MSAQQLIQTILMINRNLDQQVQAMSHLNTEINRMKQEINTYFANTQVSGKLIGPLDSTSQSINLAIPEVTKAKESLFQLTAKIRG